MSILVSGSLCYDNIMDFPDSFKNHILPDQIHILNVSFSVARLEKGFGGTAGNIAYTIKLLGGDPIIIGALGKDGHDYHRHLAKSGIDAAHIIDDEKQHTASAYVTTDVDDNQITAFFAGPLGRTSEIHLNTITKPASITIISPNPKDAMLQHMLESRQLGLTTVFDPGQQITSFNEQELLSAIDAADFIIGNDYEIKLLENKTGWKTKEIVGKNRTLITTLGEKGSIITTPEGITEVPACIPLSIDDPTGAGDAFRGGFFVAFKKGLPLATCAKVGSVAASYAIENYGTQAHTFTMEAFAARYEKTYHEPITL